MNNSMMTMMASHSNSMTVGVGSLTFTTCPSSRTRSCCSQVHAHVLASPNAKSRGIFSLSLRLSSSSIPSNPTGAPLRRLNSSISALNSGLEASIADSNENSETLKNAKIVVESGEENKLQLRVDLTGDQTQKVFDQILTNLARTAPPIPGFRRQKGGKTSKVPNSFLIRMLGEDRVTKFVIQEILNSTMADYVRKENVDVKDRKISTTQTAEELKQLFTPGNAFGFNVIVEPENP